MSGLIMPNPQSSDSSITAFEPIDPERPASAAPTEGQLEHELPAIESLDFSPPPKGHDPYAALRIKEFRWFSGGWMIAVMGRRITSVALGWEIYDRTGQKLALGWIAGIQVIPLVLLALPAGAMADIFDRRRIIQITAVLSAICSLGLAHFSYQAGSIPYMYLTLLLLATFQTFGRPARGAILPNIVPESIFSNAVTWNASIFQVSSMVGPALAGWVIVVSLHHVGSLRLAYALDAGCTLLFALMVFAIPRPAQAFVRVKPEEGSALKTLLAGIHFVRSNSVILGTMALDLFAVLLGGAVYLLPVFAKDILNVGSVGFGWLRAAEAIGAFTMALIIAHLPPMKRAGRAMLLAVAAFGVATIVFGLSRSFVLSFVMILLIGAFDNISVVVRGTLVQILTPDVMRGRVSAVNSIFIGASNQLGGLESGVTSAVFGAVMSTMGASAHTATVEGTTLSVVLGGIGTLLVVVWVACRWPSLRRFGPLQTEYEQNQAAAAR